MKQRSDFRYLERLRVRWAEVDMQRIVFNAHYLMYFDTAMAGYWRALALPYHETVAQFEGDFYVRKATVEYEGSARYDDACDVGMRCGRIGNTSLRIDAALFRGAQRLVLGELVYVWADPATQTSRPVPEALRAWFEAYESGQPMLELRAGPWSALQGDAQPLRQAVFVDEQGLPPWLSGDADDPAATQVVAYNRLGRAVGTGRLSGPAGAEARIGRLAVMQSLRGAGVGAAIVRRLIDAAVERRAAAVTLSAAEGTERFYRGLAFEARGEPFMEAGVRHQEMVRRL